jgi:hypothetical protein
MVIDKKKHSDKPGRNQGSSAAIAEPNKIAASTHFDFQGHADSPIMPTLCRVQRGEGLGSCCDSA